MRSSADFAAQKGTMLAPSAPVDLFDFDCPNKYIDISAEQQPLYSENGIKEWFFTEHPLHEPQPMPLVEETEPAAKKRPSILKSSGVARIPQPSRKSDSSETTVQKPNPSLHPPTKTTVTATTFSKPIVGSKRVLSQSQDSTASEGSKKGTLLSKEKTASTSVKNAKTSTKDVSTASSARSSSSSMSSKLEEYRQTKKAVVPKGSAPQNNKRPSAAAAAGSAKNSQGGNKKTTKDDQDMLEILKKHNEKFVAAPLYEPSRHSVRDVRKWEKQNGKTWSSLSPEEREVANKDITAMKSS